MIYPAANLSTGTVVELVNGGKEELDTQMKMEVDEKDIVELPLHPFPSTWIIQWNMKKYLVSEEFADQMFFHVPLDNPLQATWQWSSKKHKKASILTIHDKVVTRNGVAHNPSIMTTAPFTRTSFYFQTRVIKLGKFVGFGMQRLKDDTLGFADSNYLVSSGGTLGSQMGGINCAYFW